jgi:hypothetical protein
MHMARASLNGHHHAEILGYTEADRLTYLADVYGIMYEGAGEWSGPEGLAVESQGGDDWLITLPDGTALHVWTED